MTKGKKRKAKADFSELTKMIENELPSLDGSTVLKIATTKAD